MPSVQSSQTEPRLITHLEHFLGPISGGWSRSLLGATFQVALFESLPIARCSACTTLGMSQQPLAGGARGRAIHQELMMMLRPGKSIERLPALLAEVANEALASGKAILRGEVLGPRDPIWNGSRLVALYATSPVYLPKEFAVCELADEVQCVLVWLVPITLEEVEYVKVHGWLAFEAVLENTNPDLLVVDRNSCVVQV